MYVNYLVATKIGRADRNCRSPVYTIWTFHDQTISTKPIYTKVSATTAVVHGNH
jgi:hypothetical protein